LTIKANFDIKEIILPVNLIVFNRFCLLERESTGQNKRKMDASFPELDSRDGKTDATNR